MRKEEETLREAPPPTKINKNILPFPREALFDDYMAVKDEKIYLLSFVFPKKNSPNSSYRCCQFNTRSEMID